MTGPTTMGGARLGLRLARRNLWRNSRRTILTLSAVAFATAILVIMISFQRGAYRTMIQSAVGVFTGDLQVQAAGYHDKPLLETKLDGASALAQRIAATPGVENVAVRGRAYALISSSKRTLGAMVVGVQPDREPAVSTVPHSVRTGRFLRDPDASEAVLGQKLANTLSVAPGDTLTLLGQGNDGALAAATLTVVGIFSSGEAELDRSALEIPLHTFQETFAMPDAAHAIVVRTTGLDAVDGTVTALQERLAEQPDAVVLPWSELLEGLKQGITLDAAVGWFLYAVLVLVVTFSILNTFLMAVFERTREFGVLLSLGVRPGFLGRVVMAESVLLLLLGLALGLLLGGGIAGIGLRHGLAFGNDEALLAQWNLPTRIYPRLDWFSLTVGPAAILVVTSLAALFPLFRIRRLRPVDAMRAV